MTRSVEFLSICPLIIVLICCSPAFAANENKPVKPSSNGRAVEVKAAGRPFEPGVLYDAVTEKVLSSSRPIWPKQETRVERKEQMSITARMYTSDSPAALMEDKLKILNISSELKLSLTSGLIQSSGSFEYLNEKKPSGKHASFVVLVITVTTDHESYVPPDLIPRREKDDEQARKDASLIATHLIAEVTYGGRAILEFPFDDARGETSSQSRLKGRLERALRTLLSSFSNSAADDKATLEALADDPELKRLSSLKCNLFADFKLVVNNSEPRPITNLGEALKVIRDIPRLTKAAKMPLTATLVPFEYIITGANIHQRVAHEIDRRFVEDIMAHYDELSDVLAGAEEVEAGAEVNKLADLSALMVDFQRILSRHTKKTGRTIASELPKIKEFGAASVLMAHLASSAMCLHDLDNTAYAAASHWLRTQRNVLRVTTMWLERLNESGAVLALTSTEMSRQLSLQQKSPASQCLLVISLPTVALDESRYLDQLEGCLQAFVSAGKSASSAARLAGQSQSGVDMITTPGWARDLTSKQFSALQQAVQHLLNFLRNNQAYLKGRVFVGLQQQSSLFAGQKQQHQHLRISNQPEPQASSSSLLKMNVHCPASSSGASGNAPPAEFKIPQPPQNITISSNCNKFGESICVLTMSWDEPSAATAAATNASKDESRSDDAGPQTHPIAAAQYLMRCRRAKRGAYHAAGGVDDASSWTKDIAITPGMPLLSNPCCKVDKKGVASAAAAQDLDLECEFQVQAKTQSWGRSDWSESVFHPIQKSSLLRINTAAEVEHARTSRLQCPDNAEWIEGPRSHCFLVRRSKDGSYNFDSSRTLCKNLGGDLATIRDKEEHDLIAEVLTELSEGPKYYAWIGLKRNDRGDSSFGWLDGSRLNFTAWHPQEPNNKADIENCVEIRVYESGSGVPVDWNDRTCADRLQGYVCQVRKVHRSDKTGTMKIHSPEDSALTKLLVVGGDDHTAHLHHVEVIDLSGKSLTCPQLRDGPLSGPAVGAFIQGNAVICAGPSKSNKCYTYSNRMDTWDAMPGNLTYSHSYRAAVVLSDSRWWLTGGGCCPHSGNTEMLTFNGRNAESQAFTPSLPRPASEHHMLLLNESTVILVGGYDEDDDLWVFNINTNKWTQMQSMPRAKEAPVAGLATFGNGTQQQLVVTGGELGRDDTSTFVFNFNTNVWRVLGSNGNLPHDIYRARSVQYKDTFLLVGGFSDQKWDHLNTIFEFDPKNEKWIQRKEILQEKRSLVAAFLIPDSYIECGAE